MSERDEMLKIAETVARFLLTIPEVAQVGLFGSVARGEEDPSDIDLFVLTAEPSIPERILRDADECGEWLYPSGYVDALKALGASDRLDELDAVSPDVDLNIIVMPATPSCEYLWEFQLHNWDYWFLENTADDFRLFDPESGFRQSPAPWADYVEAQRKAEEVLKERLLQEEESLELLYQEWERVGDADEFPGPR